MFLQELYTPHVISPALANTKPPGVGRVHATGVGELTGRRGGEARGVAGPGPDPLVPGDRRRLPGRLERH